MAVTGFYSGSFDPVTLGHMDIIRRAMAFCDALVVGVGVHDAKRPMFAADERVAMLEAAIAGLGDIRVVTFDNLAIDAARSAGASIIVRGVRNTTDLNYESQMASMNTAMAPGLETVFLVATPDVSHIAANLVRQIAVMGGDPSAFVSEDVARRLAEKQG